MKSLFIAYVVLELVDGMGKALDFCWKENESHSLNIEERKEEKKEFIVCGIRTLVYGNTRPGLYIVCGISTLVSGNTRPGLHEIMRLEDKQYYQFVIGDNLIVDRIDDLLKVGIALSK